MRESTVSASRSDTAGTITGIRFYKSAANTGTHIAPPVDEHRKSAGCGYEFPAKPVQAGNRLPSIRQ